MPRIVLDQCGSSVSLLVISHSVLMVRIAKAPARVVEINATKRMVKQMQVPIQISFEHVEHSNGIEQRIHEELDKLEQFCDRLTKARVVVGKDQHRHQKGDSYNVQIILTVPGAEDIVIARDPAQTGRHEDLSVAISDAFSAARRRLQDLVRKRQRHPKANDTNSGRG